MARVEIPAPGDLIMDAAGNVRVRRGGDADARWDRHRRDALLSALTGGTSTTGGLVTGSDGTIVDGSGT
jgi:hypothetical protein